MKYYPWDSERKATSRLRHNLISRPWFSLSGRLLTQDTTSRWRERRVGKDDVTSEVNVHKTNSFLRPNF
jgi:hypothetical protein